LFSATFSPEINRLASSYLQNPVTIEVARPNQTASTVTQLFFNINEDDKRRALKQILKQKEILIMYPTLMKKFRLLQNTKQSLMLQAFGHKLRLT
jgi:superfamily II DNA/RNA helicase